VGQGLRLENWPARLNAAIEAQRHIPYVLGEEDCLKFACACAEALTGIDYYAPWRGRYRTRLESYRLMLEYAGGGLGKGADKLHGLDARRDLKNLHRGDWVLYRDENDDHLGICLGARAVGYQESGLTFFPLSLCIRGWAI
jgi:hypothetical protein